MGKLYHDVENGNGLPASIVTSTGAVSVNTTRLQGELIKIYVKATTVSTQFDCKLTDSKGRIIVHYQEHTGTLRDITREPLVGKYTLTIENATADEAFDVLLRLGE